MLNDYININGSTVLITGAAGFIGSNLAKRLLAENPDCRIVGIDSITDYYDTSLKYERLADLESYGDRFMFVKGSISDRQIVDGIFKECHPEIVVNLAAQAGVRYSIENPDAYIDSNLIGFYNILEACRHSYDPGHTPVRHLVFASSSSV